MSLEHELEVYRSALPEILGEGEANEGKYTVIKDDDVQGPFDGYESALDFAYKTHGLTPFLVKKIEARESVHFLSKNVV